MASKKKVILAEDDGALRNMLGKILEDDYELSVQRNGQGVLEALDAGLPDLILLDIRMPVMDGLQVLAEMKRRGLLERVPVVMLSNLEDSDQVNEAMELGAVGYLKKADVDFNDLRNKVSAYLR